MATTYSSAQSSGGVPQRPGWTSPGEIATPGPGLPGLSRFWQLTISPAGPIAALPSAATMAVTEGVDSQDGAATWVASSSGIIPRPGWTSPGQIGRPGPGLPGLSRFWQLRLLPGAPASTIAEVTGSVVVTGSDDSLVSPAVAVDVTTSGVRPRIGWSASGQIGRPGPARPGLSRFWQLARWSPRQIPSLDSLASMATAGSDDRMDATNAAPDRHLKWTPGLNRIRTMKRSQIYGFGFADKKGLPE